MPQPHEALTEAGSPGTLARYVVSSWTLADSHAYLMQREPERMVYVTGLRIGEYRSLERLVPFALEQQTRTYVRGNPRATRDALLSVAQHGLALHAVLHSHRMNGEDGVTPSKVDERHQHRLERGGYPAISGIFSEDSYIRFFATAPFTVDVIGTGVERLDESGHLLRLTLP